MSDTNPEPTAPDESSDSTDSRGRTSEIEALRERVTVLESRLDDDGDTAGSDGEARSETTTTRRGAMALLTTLGIAGVASDPATAASGDHVGETWSGDPGDHGLRTDVGSSTNVAVYGASDSTGARALKGVATATSGRTIGVEGKAHSPDSVALLGNATATQGVAKGLEGRSAAKFGTGVVGNAKHDTGTTKGVRGLAQSPNGRGVEGINTSGSGETYGVRGAVDSPSGYGLYTPDDAKVGGTTETGKLHATTSDPTEDTFAIRGQATASSATTYGVGGLTLSSDWLSAGIIGRAVASSGRTTGVQGTTWSSTDDAAGVRGGAAGERGITSGVEGTTWSSESGAAGVRGKATVGSGQTYGVHGETDSSQTDAAGVRGEARAASGQAIGVRGETESPDGFGFYTPDDASVRGDLGVGTDSPVAQFHVSDDTDGPASLENHVAVIENTSSDGEADVLALKIAEPAPLESWNNYVTFKDGNNDPVGSIEGDGSGGVNYTSASGDYAEFMPRLDPGESIAPADVVGVVGDSVTKRAAEADQALVVSDRSIVTGNAPGTDPEDRAGHEACAFVGQVPVRVHGSVAEGDLIVPSGDDDGTGRAIAPVDYRPGDGPLVGRAWEASDDAGVTEVLVAVGLETGEALEATVTDQQARIDALEAENEALRERLDAIEERVAGMDQGATGQASADD